MKKPSLPTFWKKQMKGRGNPGPVPKETCPTRARRMGTASRSSGEGPTKAHIPHKSASLRHWLSATGIIIDCHTVKSHPGQGEDRVEKDSMWPLPCDDRGI